MGLRGRQILTAETHFFVTTIVVNHARVFVKDRYCEILLSNMKHYQETYKYNILGYVIMPSHFHWIVETDPNRGTISDIMRDLKKFSARDLMDALKNDGKDKLLKLFESSANKYKTQKRKFWMHRFDDKVIRDDAMLITILDYIHYNPVKEGLVMNPEDYRYSSARNYILNDHSKLIVKTEW